MRTTAFSTLKRLALTGALCLAPSLAFAQSNSHDGDGACAACFTIFFIIPFVYFVLNMALCVWVARDAKARGMDSAVLWMLLVLFTSLIGLFLYLFSRPQGNTISCSNCGNEKLQAAIRCSYCGFGA